MTLDVYVASSLSEAFDQLESDYENENPNVDIRLNIAGSSTLLRQIEAGASVDVFAPADVSIFTELTNPPTGQIEPVATNTLVLVVPTKSENTVIDSVDDLEGEGVVVARCTAGVPCGTATDEFLEATDITLGNTSEHLNVAQVTEQVAASEADAGFAYETDAVRKRAQIRAIPLESPPMVQPGVATFGNRVEVTRFVQYVTSEDGQETFADLGFGPPAG